MSQRGYKKLDAEYRRKNRQFPDNGYSSRPWEAGLKEKIRQVVTAGLIGGHGWAKTAARNWNIDPQTGQFREW
jgi:hypothetical protein